ncbi:MAG TPA: RHS repeat-associated core domain-containing protein, partial [Acidimicrobiales bacterium]|nr:RHS repeat-associated core domain-containing protein [Acidimicrobiales bacterium]
FSLYSLAPGVSPNEVAGGGSPYICDCTRPATHYPVNTATGEFYHTFTDISIRGRGILLDFERTYSSLNAAILGPLGYGWSDSYAMALTVSGSLGTAGSTATVLAANGSEVIFTSNGTSWVAPGHVLASLVPGTGGSTEFTDKAKSVYTFNASGELTSEADRNAYTTSLAYNGSNQLTTVTDPAGRTLTFAYGSNGLIASMTDSGSPARSVYYTYDGSDDLTTVTDVRGDPSTFVYNSSHLLTVMKDQNCVAAGNACDGVRNTYDGSGRVTQQLDQMNRVTTLSYSATPIGMTTTITEPNGDETLDVYANNLLLSETRGYATASAATTTYEYDPSTLAQVAVTDPNGNTTSSVRDSGANVLAQTDALGRTATYTYNSFNEPLTITDPLGIETTHTYDANGNLTQTSTPLAGTSPLQNQVTSYAYGDSTHPGDMTQMTDPDGKLWAYTYDSYGDKASQTDPLGDKTTYLYDAAGNMTSRVMPLGNVSGGTPANYTWTYTYNPADQALTQTDPLNNQTQSSYDQNGNLIQQVDPNSNVTDYAYDLDNEKTSETDGAGSLAQRTLQTTYDGNGNVLQQVDGNRNVTSYTYDALNRKITTSDPLDRITTYTYDPAGNLLTTKDPRGQTTTNTYDGAGQLLAEAYSSLTTANVSYTYDADGQRISMSDGTGTSTYVYDSLHRLTQTTDGAGNQLQYAYDLKGQATSITYPGSHTVTQGYDGAGRLTTIQDWLSHTTTYKYDADSNNYEIDYPNATTASLSYDHSDRLMATVDAKSGTAFLNLSYTRNDNSTLTGDGTNTYGYDALNRVTGANSTGYTYDGADQMTQAAVSGGNTTTLSYDIANQLKSLVVSNGGSTISSLGYSYDQNGNRTRTIDQSGNNTTYSYDGANRLQDFQSPSSGAGYGYNGDGLLTSEYAAGSTTVLVWNPQGSLPLIVQAGTTSYVNGPDGLPLEQVTSAGSVYYYHQDQIGNTLAMTDASGAVQQSYHYDPYGNLTSSSGTISNPFQFQGQYLDPVSGLYYLRARFYDPVAAAFTIKDPVADVTGHPYVYVGDSPLNSADPKGLFGFGDIGRFVSHVPWQAVGVGLGVGAVTLSVLALLGPEIVIAGVTVGAVQLAIGAGFLGAAAAALDINSCQTGPDLACAGLAFGVLGAVAGGGGAGAAVAGGEAAAAALGGLATNVGIAATIADAAAWASRAGRVPGATPRPTPACASGARDS